MEKINPYYSIIIPHFNIPHLLDRLISTIPKREDLQVIVVDDCSTKDLNILEGIRSKYSWVEWYDTGVNGGGGKARNIGLKVAKGKYLLFADADDFFLPNLNQILDDYINESHNDLIIFNSISLNSDSLKPGNRGRDWSKSGDIFYKNIEIMQQVRFLFGEPWSKIIKKDLIDFHDIKFDETNINNDTYFSYMTGFLAEKVKIDFRYMYCITERLGSVTKNKSKDNLKIRTEIFAKKNKFFKDNKIDIYDYLLITPFIESKNNKLLLKELYSIAKRYGFSKNSINLHIYQYLFILLKNKIKKIFPFLNLR